MLEGEPRYAWSTRNWANWMMATMTASLYRVTGISQLMGFVAFSPVGFLGKAVFARTMLGLHPLLGRPADAAAIAAMSFPSQPHVSLLLAVIALVFAAATLAFNYQSLVRPERDDDAERG